jgi:hypothetical protein
VVTTTRAGPVCAAGSSFGAAKAGPTEQASITNEVTPRPKRQETKVFWFFLSKKNKRFFLKKEAKTFFQ